MKNQNFIYAMRITKLAENDFYVDYPFSDMNIHGSAESLEEAIEIAKSSLEFTLFDMYEEDEEFPVFDEDEVSELEKTKEANQFITLIGTSMKTVVEKFGEKKIVKSITIPQYQDFWLKKTKLNLSQFVQDKLNKEIER
ncbi:type II toxin-antitoxin system HicB family antitoxin [Enterococcus hulanensis]|uniref:type II toxin-antitoxin system HicB family antitoxin n=1 Tax=Enterococcus hulanensis TaxID=2559929 RepID=UPI0010F7DD12|nr:type II toxin-antitoxin system HicB family antitoxin [Enterococcus hulanensis]MBO0455823.1 type II toxin-antitoxin system HicB family antitoxin [Enterococcus hulanensis]